MQCSLAATVSGAGLTARPAVAAPRAARHTAPAARPVTRVRAAEDDVALEALRGDEDLEAQLEQFMKEQAAVESGLEAVIENPSEVIGADEVDDATARKYCMDIVEALKKLQMNRDMTINEVKLTIAIEDPRSRENRRMGVEDRIVNRDEMATALVEVASGSVPRDRAALYALWQEIDTWPFLDEDNTEAQRRVRQRESLYAAAADMPDARQRDAAPSTQGNAPAPLAGAVTDMVQPPEQAEKSTLMGSMPEWVGYLPVYAVSLIPAGILFFWVSLLWTTSFKY